MGTAKEISDKAIRRMLTSIRNPVGNPMYAEYVKIAYPHWVKIHKAWTRRKKELLKEGK